MTDQTPVTMSPDELALELFTTGQSMTGGRPEAERLLKQIKDRAVSSVGQAPTPDRTALRERIANKLAAEFAPDGDATHGMRVIDDDGDGPAARRVRPHEAADAVLAMLPEPADRTAVLREAADALDADMERFFREWPDEPRNSPCALGRKDSADELRRLADPAAVVSGRAADEAALPDQTSDETAHPPTMTWKIESPRRDQWASWGTTYDDHEWARERYDHATATAPARPFRLVRATTTYTVEVEHAPADVPAVGGAQQPTEAEAATAGDQTRPECAHCWREIENRSTPSMGSPAHDNWVHVPGGFTACFPQRGGDSPRAEPRATEARP